MGTIAGTACARRGCCLPSTPRWLVEAPWRRDGPDRRWPWADYTVPGAPPCSSHSRIAPASCSTEIAQPRRVRIAGLLSFVINIELAFREDESLRCSTGSPAQGSDSKSKLLRKRSNATSAYARADVDARTLACVPRSGAGRYGRPTRELEQSKQLFRNKAGPGRVDVPVTL
jgi:hypothetical protein